MHENNQAQLKRKEMSDNTGGVLDYPPFATSRVPKPALTALLVY